VGRVVKTWLFVSHYRWQRRVVERTLQLLALLAAFAFVSHLVIGRLARISPPPVLAHHPARVDDGALRTVGRSSALRRQGIWEVLLRGSPAEIGFAHSTLLWREMVETERSLLGTFEHYVPAALARQVLLDVALLRFRDVHRGMSVARLEELAAGSAAFTPDPFESFLPTYQRFVYLNALYDISLSLEHSPLLGCTTFTADRTGPDSGPLLARVFDFEVHDVFDRQKAVFFVAEEGELPFASVAWPGLVGVVSGMNVAGLALVVHGARGGTFTSAGEPVVHAVRRVLGRARTTDEAFRLLVEQPAMVSHIVVAQDALGHAVRIERAPGRQATVIELGNLAVSSNHFEGPLSADPKNLRVMRETSTLARRARGDMLIRASHGPVEPSTLAAWLRDERAADGTELAAGDRRAINAGIATHAVIVDTMKRTLWVSQGPHLDGDFVRYDLSEIFEREDLLEPAALRPTLGPGD
jgi:isopenicillin-N N-acyltransferase like protein